MGARSGRRSRRVEPTEDWEVLVPLFEWPEQERYEEIRPLVLFGSPVAERAEEVGTSKRTLYRRMDRFASEGLAGLFDSETAKRHGLPPAVRRLVVDLKAEYPAFNLNEIANAVYVCFGRKPDVRTIRKVLDEEPMPLKMVRRYPPYREITDARGRRSAVVELHADGWSAKAIAGYLGTHKSTVYRALRRWIEEGEQGAFGQAPGETARRTQGRPQGHRGGEAAAGEPRAGGPDRLTNPGLSRSLG